LFSPQPPTSPIHTLSLHDALPISAPSGGRDRRHARFLSHLPARRGGRRRRARRLLLHHDVRKDGGRRRSERRRALALHTVELRLDRKSTRLNSSHVSISYAVFCLK